MHLHTQSNTENVPFVFAITSVLTQHDIVDLELTHSAQHLHHTQRYETHTCTWSRTHLGLLVAHVLGAE
jgi:hypothetical protein